MDFPGELWTLIKDYQINHKKHHRSKYKKTLRSINYSFDVRIKHLYRVDFPPPRFITYNEWIYGRWGETDISPSNRNGKLHLATLKLELTGIEYHKNGQKPFQPIYCNALYGWKNLKRLYPEKY